MEGESMGESMGESININLNINPDDYKDELFLDLNPINYPMCGMCILITDDITIKDVLSKPLEEQMMYADAITRKYVKNERFKNMQILEYRRKRPSLSNPTVLGNLALLYYNDRENFRELYLDFISQLGYR